MFSRFFVGHELLNIDLPSFFQKRPLFHRYSLTCLQVEGLNPLQNVVVLLAFLKFLEKLLQKSQLETLQNATGKKVTLKP